MYLPISHHNPSFVLELLLLYSQNFCPGFQMRCAAMQYIVEQIIRCHSKLSCSTTRLGLPRSSWKTTTSLTTKSDINTALRLHREIVAPANMPTGNHGFHCDVMMMSSLSWQHSVTMDIWCHHKTKPWSSLSDRICGYTMYHKESDTPPFLVTLLDQVRGSANITFRPPSPDFQLNFERRHKYRFEISAHDCQHPAPNHAPRYEYSSFKLKKNDRGLM